MLNVIYRNPSPFSRIAWFTFFGKVFSLNWEEKGTFDFLRANLHRIVTFFLEVEFL